MSAVSGAEVATFDGLSLVAFAAVGLLGGAHCLGMCGPLVTMYGSHLDDDASVPRQHALFNLGRTAGYAAVGGLLGLLGGAAFDAAALVAVADPFRGVVGVLAGGIILLTGLGYVAGGTGGALARLPDGGLFARATRALSARVEDWVGGPRIAALGALHAGLPCPILYPAYLYALVRGSPTWGALSLSVVGLGTFPTLFLSGVAMGSLSAEARVRVHRVLGVAFVGLALAPLGMGLGLLGVPVPHPSLPVFRPW